MENKTLFLSKDKEYLLNENDERIAIKTEMDGRIFYKEIDLDSKANGRVCVGWKSKKVCLEVNGAHYCVSWGEVEVCAEWSYGE